VVDGVLAVNGLFYNENQKVEMDTRSGRILINWMAVITYCVVIWVMSTLRSPLPVPTFDHSDKVLHLLAFVVLAVLFWRAFAVLNLKSKSMGLVLLTFLCSTAFGVLIEVNQYFLSHRRAEGWDLAADMLGCASGIILCLLFFRGKRA
jgi:VanZ family protein